MILSSKHICEDIYSEIRKDIKLYSLKPCLAVILVGSKSDSVMYVKMKRSMCAKIGIRNLDIDYSDPENINDKVIIDKIEELNSNPEVSGIMIQLPLPSHLNTSKIVNTICPEKDVDGLTDVNFAKLAMGTSPYFNSCTPAGCMELLKRCGIELYGKHIVIIGCSRMVGKPLAHMCLNEEATVTMCHIATQNIKSHTKAADILFSACGQAQMIKSDWVKEDVVIVDIGISKIPDESSERGYKIVGDVDFEDMLQSGKPSFITPVPGGVGPMTICMLMKHVVKGHIAAPLTL